MTRRLLLALVCALVTPIGAAAQSVVFSVPPGSFMPSVIVFPASAVNGGGTVSSAQLFAQDGACGTTPAYSFASQTDTGWYRVSGSILGACSGGTNVARVQAQGLNLGTLAVNWGSGGISGALDTALTQAGAGKLVITGTTPMLMLGGTTSSAPALKQSSTNIEHRLADDSGYTGSVASDYNAVNAQPTVGAGTGITVNTSGAQRTQIYKVTVASTNFIAAAVTADVTIATLPAKTVLSWAIADLTQTFACASTCTTATLSMTCGKTAGGAEYLVSFDADAATGQFGTTQATAGASLKTATPPNTGLGDLPSWSGTTAVQCRLTSGTGNIGTGAATNLSQGSITFYLTTVRMP